MIITPNFAWWNWNRSQACVATLYEPESLDDLCEAVNKAAKKGRVRLLGSGCSWSTLVPSPTSLISMRRLNRLLSALRYKTHDPMELSPIRHAAPDGLGATDDQGGYVRLEGGVTMQQLVEIAPKFGLTVISPTVYQGLTLGGAIAVAAHGTGLSVSTLSDAVLSMTMVDAEGQVREISPSNSASFDAARVGLGCFGVMYAATLRCARDFNLRVEEKLVPVDQALSNLKDILATYEFVEMFWFPFSDVMWLKLMNRMQDLPDTPAPGAQLLSSLQDAVVKFSGKVVIPAMSHLFPGLTPQFGQFAQRLTVHPGSHTEPANSGFHYQDAYPKCWDMSYNIPIEDSKAAWAMTIDLVRSYGRRKSYPVNIVVHARYIGKSVGLLSPAYGRVSCDLEVVTNNDTPDSDVFYREFELQMLKFPGARPHWGKYFTQPAQIAARYPKWQDFLKYREAADPGRVFLNDYLEKEVFHLPPLESAH